MEGLLSEARKNVAEYNEHLKALEKAADELEGADANVDACIAVIVDEITRLSKTGSCELFIFYSNDYLCYDKIVIGQTGFDCKKAFVSLDKKFGTEAPLKDRARDNFLARLFERIKQDFAAFSVLPVKKGERVCTDKDALIISWKD